MTAVERAKALIFPAGDELPEQDTVLETIGELVGERLLMAVKAEAPFVAELPKELEYIAVEVIVKRYNRIGSEGMTSETLSGHSASFELKDDLADYLDDIKAWADAQEDNDEKYKRTVRFL